MEDGTEVREDMQEENDNIQSNSRDNMTKDENLNTSASCSVLKMPERKIKDPASCWK